MFTIRVSFYDEGFFFRLFWITGRWVIGELAELKFLLKFVPVRIRENDRNGFFQLKKSFFFVILELQIVVDIISKILRKWSFFNIYFNVDNILSGYLFFKFFSSKYIIPTWVAIRDFFQFYNIFSSTFTKFWSKNFLPKFIANFFKNWIFLH